MAIQKQTRKSKTLQVGKDIHYGKSQATFKYNIHIYVLNGHFRDQSDTEIELVPPRYIPWHITSTHKGIYQLETQEWASMLLLSLSFGRTNLFGLPAM